MKKKLLFLLILLMPFVVNAEELKLDWNVSLGGDASDVISDLKVFDDGSSLVTGYTYSSSILGVENTTGTLFYVVKYDNDGNIEWYKTFNDDNYTSIDDINLIPEKGYLVSVKFIGNGVDELLILFDFNGNIIWEKKYSKNEKDIFRDFYIGNDFIFVIGTTESTDIEGYENNGKFDILLLKYDLNGNLLWERAWGEEYYDELSTFYINDKNEIIISGVTTNAEENVIYDSDIFLLKFDLDGNLLKEKIIDAGGRVYIESAPYYSDDSFALLIRSDSSKIGEYVNDEDLFKTIVMKFDHNFDLLMLKELFNFDFNLIDYSVNNNEELFLLFYSNNSDLFNELGIEHNGGYDPIIIKYDKDFEIVFKKSYGGSGRDIFYNINMLEDKIVAVGDTNSTDFDVISYGKLDGLVVLLDMDGNIIKKQSYGGSDNDLFSYVNIHKNNLYIDGITVSTDIDGVTFNGGAKDLLFAKFVLSYDMTLVDEVDYGTAVLSQKDDMCIVSPSASVGYEVDEIIVKDNAGNVLNVEVAKLEDGTYSFPLYTDVSVEVLFKEILENPKTGVISYIGLLISMLICSFLAFWFIMKKDNKYEL